MFEIQFQISVCTEDRFLIGLETDVSAQVEGGLQQVLPASFSTNQFVSHSVVDVEEIVSVFTSILHHLSGEGPEGGGREEGRTEEGRGKEGRGGEEGGGVGEQ